MITSSSNAKIKQVIQLNTKAKARRQLGLFVVEGVKMFLEAPRRWIRQVFITESLWQEEAWKERLQGCPAEVVSDKVFRSMCDTMTPQGILTVLQMPQYTISDILQKENPLLLVLEDLQDPGNVGTIFRTAEGAGADGIFMTKGCVDVFNPKTIRSTMGSIYRMPFFQIEDTDALAAQLREKHISSFAAHLQGKADYDRADYRGGTAFFIGNEGNGLSREMTALADCLIRIPMKGQVESLNAAMACGILVYEAARQRRD